MSGTTQNKPNFIVKKGILGFGLIMFVGTITFDFVVRGDRSVLYPPFLIGAAIIWSIAGYFFGLWLWRRAQLK